MMVCCYFLLGVSIWRSEILSLFYALRLRTANKPSKPKPKSVSGADSGAAFDKVILSMA
ncbi:hypothetical protein MNBD_ALPHA02-1297 [hydrothermal vent metagenome]|uniref:Uncharacterized protein n=1 Tax=hydrothermal vent metagenome TaxID=652676 RepID=A0A3B0RPC2_9ZZZZ